MLGPGVADLDGQRVAGSFIMPCGRCRHCVRGHEDLCEVFFDFNRLRGVLYDGQARLFRPDGDPVWMYSMGGLAEVCIVPTTAVFPVPQDVDLSDAAVLGCSVFTAFGATQNVARLASSDTVAVVGIGGVGATSSVSPPLAVPDELSRLTSAKPSWTSPVHLGQRTL